MLPGIGPCCCHSLALTIPRPLPTFPRARPPQSLPLLPLPAPPTSGRSLKGTTPIAVERMLVSFSRPFSSIASWHTPTHHTSHRDTQPRQKAHQQLMLYWHEHHTFSRRVRGASSSGCLLTACCTAAKVTCPPTTRGEGGRTNVSSQAGQHRAGWQSRIKGSPLPAHWRSARRQRTPAPAHA